MNTKIYLSACLVLSVYFFKAQTNKEFEEYKKNEAKAFQDYKEKENKEFANFLKQRWAPFTSKKGQPAPINPKPLVIPTNVPKPIDQPNKDNLPLVKPELKGLEFKPAPQPFVTSDKFESKKAIVFYGTPLSIGYNPFILQHVSSISEDGLGNYWDLMCSKNYSTFVNEIEAISVSLSLNDWGKYLLIKKISEQFHQNKNDQVCLQFFILNQLGFDSKVAKADDNFVLLLPTEELIYGISFIPINGKKYYVINSNGSSFYTFNKSFSSKNKSISFNSNKALTINDDIKQKVFTLKNGKTIIIDYNANAINYLNDFPQAELSVFFNYPVTEITEMSILRELKPQLVGLSEIDAVNFLLSFLHSSFEYKTDDQQFGREKWFYPEHLFFYPFSDCEDRSILFAYLVKSLLNLEVIGLNYENHVSTAVLFNGDVKGDKIVYKNKSYLACDPTYIGASVGMTMPQFINAAPKVIDIK